MHRPDSALDRGSLLKSNVDAGERVDSLPLSSIGELNLSFPHHFYDLADNFGQYF
jgi:hypothetical protein